MSCDYYHWDHGYACRKTGKNVNEDTYYKYCRGYTDYEDCPIYKDAKRSAEEGNCFLTSACVEAMGLADDCYELTILRQYRDNYLRTTPNGSADICEYYHIAPVIVAKIHERADACKVFERIYRELVKPCVKLIEEKRFEDAHRTYKEYTMLLAKEFA